MPLCTRNVVSGPFAGVSEAVYSRIDKIATCFPRSHFTYVWDPHVRVIFNLPPQTLVGSAPGCPSTATRRRQVWRSSRDQHDAAPARTAAPPRHSSSSLLAHTQRGRPAAAPQSLCPAEEPAAMRASARSSRQRPPPPSPSSCGVSSSGEGHRGGGGASSSDGGGGGASSSGGGGGGSARRSAQRRLALFPTAPRCCLHRNRSRRRSMAGRA
jgi:uncharacterized membrane protein YgcG